MTLVPEANRQPEHLGGNPSAGCSHISPGGTPLFGTANSNPAQKAMRSRTASGRRSRIGCRVVFAFVDLPKEMPLPLACRSGVEKHNGNTTHPEDRGGLGMRIQSRLRTNSYEHRQKNPSVARART